MGARRIASLLKRRKYCIVCGQAGCHFQRKVNLWLERGYSRTIEYEFTPVQQEELRRRQAKSDNNRRAYQRRCRTPLANHLSDLLDARVRLSVERAKLSDQVGEERAKTVRRVGYWQTRIATLEGKIDEDQRKIPPTVAHRPNGARRH